MSNKLWIFISVAMAILSTFLGFTAESTFSTIMWFVGAPIWGFNVYLRICIMQTEKEIQEMQDEITMRRKEIEQRFENV